MIRPAPRPRPNPAAARRWLEANAGYGRAAELIQREADELRTTADDPTAILHALATYCTDTGTPRPSAAALATPDNPIKDGHP